jgi:pimeloyl-ACP methyl ester carboxylesterase
MNLRHSGSWVNRGRRALEITTSSPPEGTVRLRDGRQLAYAEYGDPQGKPIFFFHGTPGSRLFHHPDAAVTASAGARIIAVDRPGFGRSDFKPGRTLLDWPNDVTQLADALQIQRFQVLGYCGGGPYALVCASSLPDRAEVVGLVSSMAPLDNPQMASGMHGMGHLFFSVDRHLPPLAKLGCRLVCATWRNNPSLYFKSQVNGFRNSEDGSRLLSKMEAMLTADFLEAVRAGTEGVAWDLQILAQPWGFHLHVIKTDVLLWHGENDTQAPVVMGKRLAGALPHCRGTFFPEEGHWAIHSHWQEILTALVQTRPAPHEEAQPQVVVLSTEGVHAGPGIVPPAPAPDIATVEMPADIPQGLQPPAREQPKEIPAASAEISPAIPGEASVTVAAQPEPAPEAAKPITSETARCPAEAAVEVPAEVSPKPAPEEVKMTSKKTAASQSIDEGGAGSTADTEAGLQEDGRAPHHGQGRVVRRRCREAEACHGKGEGSREGREALRSCLSRCTDRQVQRAEGSAEQGQSRSKEAREAHSGYCRAAGGHTGRCAGGSRTRGVDISQAFLSAQSSQGSRSGVGKTAPPASRLGFSAHVDSYGVSPYIGDTTM